MALVELHNISKSYELGRKNEVQAISAVNLAINRGEFVGITGPSGSGKTTLLNVLGLLHQPDSGRYVLDGKPVETLKESELTRLRAKKIGIVPQRYSLLGSLTVRKNVELGLEIAKPKRAPEDEVRLVNIMAQLGIATLSGRYPDQLSGGQRQRVAIAREVAKNPDLLLADEPTGNLDSSSSKEVLDAIDDLHQSDGMTVVVVSHDPQVIDRANRVITVTDGRITSDGGRAYEYIF